jgi:hypothetical protein
MPAAKQQNATEKQSFALPLMEHCLEEQQKGKDAA